MAKWKVVCQRKADDPFIKRGGSWLCILSYSNSHMKDKNRKAVRIRNLVSIAGHTPEDLGLPVSEDYNSNVNEHGEYNGTGCHFIVVRDDVELEDFEVVVLYEK